MKNFNINNTTQHTAGARGLGIQGFINNKSKFTKGSVLEALIEGKKEGMTSLRATDGRFTFELPSQQVTGDEGDSVSFEVMSHVGDKLTLKQINENPRNTEVFAKTLSRKADASELKELMEQSEFKDRDIEALDYKAMAGNAQDNRVLERQALAKIRRQMSDTADNAGKAVVRAMAAAGVNINKLELRTLSGMMAEIRKDPYLPDEKLAAADDDAVDPASLLAQAGLPSTAGNTAALEAVSGILDAVIAMDMDMVLAYLKQTDAPEVGETGRTIGGMYKYAMAKPKKDIEPENREGRANVSREEIQRVFDRAGIPLTPELYEAAQALVRADVALTVENLEKFDFLMNFNENDKLELMKRAVQSMKEGKTPLSAPVFPSAEAVNEFNRQDYDELRLEISIIKPEHIDLALEQNQPLTIHALSEIATAAPVVAALQNTPATAAARADLLEIGVMLTYEAANRLYAKGVRIDVITLADAVAALREGERDSFAASLLAMGGTDSPENVDAVQETVEAARILGRAPEGTCIDIITSRIAFTMRAVSQNAASRIMSGEEAAAAYEAFESLPRARYGDRLRNPAEQFIRLLENLDIPATNQNVRIARILSVNHIDVTYENIVAVKATDTKLADISSRLHPLVAASMVTDGLHPLDMSVDEVLTYIDGFGDVYGYNNADILAEQIHALDKTKALDPEVRKAIIAIYKTLRVIDKNGGAGIGAAVATGGPLTLGRLMEQAAGFNDPVNTLIGEGLEFKGRTGTASKLRSILDNIGNDKDSDTEYYGKKLVQNISRNASPEALAEALQSGENPYDEELETFAERLAEINRDEETNRVDEAVNQATADAAALENVKAAVVKELMDSGIPATIPNILTYSKHRSFENDGPIIDSSDTWSDLLDEAIDDVSLVKMGKTGYEGYLEAIYESIVHEIENPEYNITEANSILHAMRLRYTVLNAQNGYYLPVKINGKITDVDIYLLRGGSELEDMENIEMTLSLKVGRNHFTANIALKGAEAEAKLAVNGFDTERGSLLASSITEAVASKDRAVSTHRAIKAGSLPERLRAAVSGALLFIENVINSERKTD